MHGMSSVFLEAVNVFSCSMRVKGQLVCRYSEQNHIYHVVSCCPGVDDPAVRSRQKVES